MKEQTVTGQTCECGKPATHRCVAAGTPDGHFCDEHALAHQLDKLAGHTVTKLEDESGRGDGRV